ncbi:2-hydroxyacid dehydrogenase [Enterovibrio calviensis]|uniref:2-hydroxyacid dehydrogenase n=1 Tax=Enterovibrio calviensis TaxID=91359 RepID=UPI0006872470|nr:glyoxylate/hydroxypyruvate reductase A [Enterovibrio calviensis]
MAILLNNVGYGNAPWRNALGELLPDDVVLTPEDAITPDDVEFALVWDHPLGDLNRYPNLKAILLLGAGTEHIDRETYLPSVPVVRLIDPDVVMEMARYALYWVLHFHRGFDSYQAQQAAQYWHRHQVPTASEFGVTVLGLGQIGAKVAAFIASNGFRVNGWDAAPKSVSGVETFSGADALSDAFEHASVVVNCLPLTMQTHHFLNTHTLSLLPTDAVLVNISRGDVIDEKAVLQFIRQKRIKGAVLDAHSIEPLPSTSALWQHPNVWITPHIAGATKAQSAAKIVVENITRIRNGEAPFPQHLPPCQQFMTKIDVASQS